MRRFFPLPAVVVKEKTPDKKAGEWYPKDARDVPENRHAALNQKHM